MLWQQVQLTDGLSWPSISFAILFGSLLLASYVLWRRYLSRRLLLQRVVELEQLSAAGREIVASELDVAALCALITQEAQKVIDNKTFQVGLFTGVFYKIMFWTIDGRPQETPQLFNLTDNPGIVGWIRNSKEPLLVHDFLKEAHTLPAAPRYISDTPPRAAIFIPMVRGDKVIGIIAAQSAQPGRFSEEDLRRVMILANQAAAAIANAHLYEEAQMRAAHLELVRKIAHQVNAVTEPEAIFDQVVRLTHEMFGFHPVNIFGIHPATGDAVLQASSLPELAHKHSHVPQGQGIVGSAVKSRQTIIVNNTSEDQRFLPPGSFTAAHLPPARAEMAIPLLVNNEVLGVLDVNSEQTGVFTPTEQTVLEALAAEVASAIHKAQQLAQQRERAWLTTAQLQVAAALSQHVTLEEIADSITRIIPILTGASLCGIMLWDEETAVYHGATLYTGSGHKIKNFARRQCAIGSWSALDAVHVGHLPLTTQHSPPWLRQHSQTPLHALTIYPLATKENRMGILFVDKPEDGHDTQAKQAQWQTELLENISGQTSRAIENAYLRQAQQEEAWVNTVLLQIAEAVNSRIELEEILTTITRLVPMLVGVESVIILIWDEENQVFQAGPSHGISKMGRGLIETLDLDQDEVPALIHLTTSQSPQMPFYIMRPSPWIEKMMGTPHAHVFPLHARGQLVGAMMVGTKARNGRTLPGRRLSILNGIAQQAATAVVNSQLYQEAAERSRLAQELDVARDIQASLIPDGSPDIPGCSIASFWRAARQVSGDFYDFIPLHSGDWGIVIADVADKGFPAALFMALSRTILRTVALNRHDPAEVLMRVNDILTSEAQSDLFVTVFYAVWQPHSKTLLYANGGHNPPLLLRSNGKARLLSGDGMALGILPGIEIEARSVRLQPNDTLLFYTDGVTEAMNEDFDEFGIERLRLAAQSARHLDAPGIVAAITDNVQLHAGDTPQFDDITLVVLKRKRDA